MRKYGATKWIEHGDLESKVTAQSTVSLRQKGGRTVSMEDWQSGNQSEAQRGLEGHPVANGLTRINRRDWLRTAVGGGVGLALDGLLDLPTVRAATQKLKLANVSEFTTSCNFCSCGCGMIAAVKNGKLVTLEGDYDHPVNRGSLCVK